VEIIYITQCAENIIIHNIIQICTLFDLYIINVQKNLQTPKVGKTIEYSPHISIFSADMVILIMTVMLQAQLRPKLRRNKDYQEPYQVPSPKVVRLSRPAGLASPPPPAKAPCPAYPT
jgi:hypothetical protein